MQERAKKRIGRPPGRTAPHRPVVSARVAKAVDAKIKAAARASGRTVGEEVIARVERSFEWEQQFGSIRELQAEARKVTAQGLQAAMVDAGYQRVRGSHGAAWFEPGVDVGNWIGDSLPTPAVEELLARGVARGIKLALEAKKS